MNTRNKKKAFAMIVTMLLLSVSTTCIYAEEAADSETDLSCDAQGYIISDSNIRYLTDEDVEGLSLQEICYAKNEIYARRGKLFSSKELQTYFSGKDWYDGIFEPEDFDANYADLILNGVEKANIDFLTEKELALGPEGYRLDVVPPMEEAEVRELYQTIIEKYTEGARTDFSTWNETTDEDVIPMEPNNPWSGAEMCYAFVDLADDGVPELLIGRIPTEEDASPQDHGITMYTTTPTNCLYAVYGYEDDEVKLVMGGTEWGWHTNACITEDKKIWIKGYHGGGYYNFSLCSMIQGMAEHTWDECMCFNTPDFPFEYGKLVNEEWVLSTEEEYRRVSAVTPLEIDWIPFLSTDSTETNDTVSEGADSVETDTAVDAAVVAASVGTTDDILPNSSEEYLTEQDLMMLNLTQLAIAKNEILARHGVIFTDIVNRAYFEGKSWYSGTMSFEEFKAGYENELNEAELANYLLLSDAYREGMGEGALYPYPELLDEYIMAIEEGFSGEYSQVPEIYSFFEGMDVSYYCAVCDINGDTIPELLIARYYEASGDYEIVQIYTTDGYAPYELVTNLSYGYFEICKGNILKLYELGNVPGASRVLFYQMYPEDIEAGLIDTICMSGLGDCYLSAEFDETAKVSYEEYQAYIDSYEINDGLSFHWISLSETDSEVWDDYQLDSSDSIAADLTEWSVDNPDNVWTVRLSNGYLALRSDMEFDYENEVGQLANGDIVNVLEPEDATYWYVYAPGLDRYGYVNCNYIYRDSTDGVYESWYVTGVNEYLPLRNLPDYNAAEIGGLQNGELVQVHDSSDPVFWYVYSPQYDVYGYVVKEYLSPQMP